jgi:heterodisulfide reductase subunit A
MVPCDNVIFSVGQRAGLAFIPESAGVEVTGRDLIAIDPDTMMTSRPGVFAGGDAVRGTAFVIDSIASGHDAAASMHCYLQGDAPACPIRPDLPVVRFTPDKVEELLERGELVMTPRQGVPELDVEERLVSFEEVSRGYTDELAQAEAARCLACGHCSECLSCYYTCEPGAIDHDMEPWVEEIDVGAIVLATGFQQYDPRTMPQYGYGKLDNVYTALELERLTNAGGPTAGQILLKDGSKPKSVAILHCIGSRDRQHNAYCSRVCCMYSMKLAHLVREKTHADVYEFYFDITAYGKGYTEFHDRVQEEGVLFIRGKGAEVEAAPNGRLMVRAEDTLLGETVAIDVDMVVLAMAMTPAVGAQEVAQIFHITRGQDGFFLEAHPKLRPVETATDGVFLAGACQAPKDIPDTVAQASGAAAQALGLLVRGRVEIEPMTAEVLALRCVACGLCVEVCPFSAVETVEQRGQKVAEINPALCKGCGICVAACRGKAITLHGYSDQQLLLQLGALLRPVEMAPAG